MNNIIYLSQNHAKSMTDMRASLQVYRKHNADGKFDEAIDGFESYYDSLMKQVLAR